MITFVRRIMQAETKGKADYKVVLPYELRQKSRLRIELDSGEHAGIILPRGTVLKNADLLADENNQTLKIEAAKEALSVFTCDSSLLFSRLCYHLGNRHVALAIGQQTESDSLWAAYLQDHVLDEMVIALGGRISHQQNTFEPETGAYHQHE